MYKVVVVDDQVFVANAIANMIKKDSEQFDVINVYYNGEKCLEGIEERTPDIVLTDIKMPKLNGIQLSEKINALYPDIKIIILSGLEDFSYAQQAISLGVCGYLLKPCSSPELIKALENAAEQLQNDRDKEAKIHQFETFLTENLPTLKQQAIISLMFSENVVDNPQKLKLDHLMNQNYFYMLSPDFTSELDKEELDHILFICSSTMLENLSELSDKEIFICNEKIILIFPKKNLMDEEIEFYLRRVCRQIESKLNCKLSCYAGGIMENILHCQQSYEQALKKMSSNSDETIRISSRDNDGSCNILENAKKYIQDNYQDDISLQEVADSLYVSYSYLSSLFTQNSGVNFSTYLTKIRIEKSCELLKDPRNKISDIADNVGYHNYRYFNYVFKKLVGYTPSEYRRIRYSEKK